MALKGREKGVLDGPLEKKSFPYSPALVFACRRVVVSSTDLSEHYVLQTQCEFCCHTFQLLGLLLHTANGFGWDSLLLALFTSLLWIKPIRQQINKVMVTSLKILVCQEPTA
jgi:hypothetical protein